MYDFVKTKESINMTTRLNFFKQYHSAMIKALGEDAKKVNAKVGSIMADNWADNAGTINNNTEFAKSFEDYLKNKLEFAEYVKIDCNENNYTLDIKGCANCHGNELLRKEGLSPACPIVQAAKYAAVKKIKKNIITKGVEKHGVVGECVMKFELQ